MVEVNIQSKPWKMQQDRPGFWCLRLSEYDKLKEQNGSLFLVVVNTHDSVTGEEFRIKLLGSLRRYATSSSNEFQFYTQDLSNNKIIRLLDAYKGRCRITCVGSIVTNRREHESLHAFHKFKPKMKSLILDPSSANKMREEEEEDVTQPTTTLDLSSEFMKDHIGKNYDDIQTLAIVSAALEKILPFTLIQGPLGTGKTHTILGILNTFHIVAYNKYKERMRDQIIQESSNNRGLENIMWPKKPKILVCAPSNSATDDILSKLMEKRFLDEKLNKYTPRVIRIGFHSQTQVGKDMGLEARVKPYLDKSNLEVSKKIQELELHIRKATNNISEILYDCQRKNQSPRKKLTKLFERVIKREKHILELSRYRLVKQHGCMADLDVSFLNEAAVIFTTVSGCRESILQKQAFDLLVVDEAAQVNEAGVLPALSLEATRYVLVGDPKQLPATVICQDAKRLGYERSLFERFQLRGYPSHLLQTQHRMHSQISRFPAQYFYMGRLYDSEAIKELGNKPYYKCLEPYKFYKVVNGQEACASGSYSPYNTAECLACLTLYKKLKKKMKLVQGEIEIHVGIITPYTSQVKHLRELFRRELSNDEFQNLSIDTIDAFQGQERDVIIFSCVKTNGTSFVGDERRMNVALTRAKMALWVLGDESNLAKCENWKALIEDARKRRCYEEI